MIRGLASNRVPHLAYRLIQLDDYCWAWTAGSKPTARPFNSRPESEATLKKYAEERSFTCPELSKQVFSIHGNVPPKGFTALFNGTDLTGWWGLGTENPKWMKLSPEAIKKKKDASQADIHKHWKVAGGELINDGRGLYLSTQKDYGDFELLLEYKTVALADSGIYLRGCPQVQIWDSTEKKKWNLGANKGSGGLWNNSKGAKGKDPLVLADNPFGEWNKMRVLMEASSCSIFSLISFPAALSTSQIK